MTNLDMTGPHLTLPPEIWENVFQFLQPGDWKSVSLVCQQFESTVTPLMWKQPAFKDQILPAQLANIRNLQLIQRLSTAELRLQLGYIEGQWEDVVERSLKYVRIVKQIANFHGFIVSRREISLPVLHAIAPHVCELDTNAVLMRGHSVIFRDIFSENEEVANILRNHTTSSGSASTQLGIDHCSGGWWGCL